MGVSSDFAAAVATKSTRSGCRPCRTRRSAAIARRRSEMQKLTSILAVLDRQATAGRVLRKAVEIARHFAAQLELLAIEPVTSGKLISQCTALGYPHIAVRTVSRLGRRLDDVVL